MLSPNHLFLYLDDIIINWSGYIKGETIGVDPRLYYLAIYAKINDLCYNLPDKSTPNPISDEKQWECMFETLEVKQVSEINIYLLPNKIIPPVLMSEKIIPVKLSLLPVATHKIIVKSNTST